LELTLNGRAVVISVRPEASLLELLRGEFGLRSMKDGCAPEGSCGACTVMVDGRAVVSCAQPAARFAGRSVVTLEGLPAETRELWADAMTASGASQCGFCSPGIVMKAEALLQREPAPARAEIARALAGNLCRCTGYVKVIDAIELAAATRRGGPAPAVERTGAIGSRTARYEARELALGERPFVNDLRVPGMLHGAIRFADHPRALVRRIDTSRAAALPGVVAVVTWRDVPGKRHQGLIVDDWPLFVGEGETTRYVGDVLAAVAAETREAAREAAALIEIDYDTISDWARSNGVLYTGFTSLANHPRVYELIAGEVEKANERLARVEQVKKFRIIPKELDPEAEGEPITPTRKVKRKVMYQRFKDLVESMYTHEEEERWAAEVGMLEGDHS